ncbi:MAG: hypothetical protein LBE36_13410 [Flavobacteriaceae bacterium]|jgi:hypothetical protein|nr:hypothetical protein [Flavobacteriaceae bacterium]
MQIAKGYTLGKIGTKYLVWNNKNEKEFTAKNLDEAKTKAKIIILEWTENEKRK